MTLLQQIRVVAGKELRDGIRDRRSVISALLFPLFGPILIAVMFTVILTEEADDSAIQVPVAGAEHAAALIEHLEAQGIEVEPAPDEPEAVVAAGDEDVVINIPADFEADFRAGRPASIELYVDSSRRESRTPIRRVRRAIESYSAKVGTLRLLARGVDPQLARPIAVEDLDTATPQRKAANLLAMVPMFVMLAVFVGGMFLATDATAGERERRSLEPLLLTPASRRGLALGKWAATTVFSSTSLVITLVGSLVAMSQVPLQEVGLQMTIGTVETLLVLGALLPLAPMAAGLQMLVASFAKSFREAQTYLSLLTLIPTLPAVFLSLKPLAADGWATLVPMMGQQVMLLGVLRGDPVDIGALLVSVAIALGIAVGCVFATAALFERERTIFGGD